MIHLGSIWNHPVLKKWFMETEVVQNIYQFMTRLYKLDSLFLKKQEASCTPS